MNKLTLTDLQWIKLLELCKVFLPEYKARKAYFEDMISLWQDNCKPVKLTSIHWYQLCLTELPKRIYEALPEQAIEDSPHLADNPIWEKVPMDIMQFQKHPVDFLYTMWEAAKREGYLK